MTCLGIGDIRNRLMLWTNLGPITIKLYSIQFLMQGVGTGHSQKSVPR